MNCTEMGYKVGDRFEIINSDCFSKGSIVELIEDDGSRFPLFKLIDGKCEYNHAPNNQPGAYEELANIKPLEKTMDIKEAYKVMQANCGIKVGDTVKVLCGWEDKDYLDCRFDKYVEDYIGKECEVLEVDSEGEYTLSDPHIRRAYFPFFVLEKIKDAPKLPASIYLNGDEDYKAEFHENGKVIVGCQSIDFETVEKIYETAKSTL